MAVRIGHASIDENRKAKGGAAGDQTGKEVKISSWYNGGWQFVARPKDPAVAEKMALACEAACANACFGYDQSQRNTGFAEAKKVGFDLSRITTPCEVDCSSLMALCVRVALGKDFYSGNAPTTRTLEKVLKSTGAFEILKDKKYLTTDKHLKRADVLCKAGSHTVMALDDGAEAEAAAPVQEATYNVKLPVLKKGSRGESVRAMQILLIGYGYSCGKAGVDGDFGSGTENALECFQEDNGLTVDCKCGPKTWAKLLGM